MPSQRLRLSAATAAGEGMAGGTTGDRRGGTVAQARHTQHAGPSSVAFAARPEREATAAPSFQVLDTTSINFGGRGKTFRLAYSAINDPDHVRHKSYPVRNFNNEAEAQAAMDRDIKSIEEGTFVAPVEKKIREQLEDYPEIYRLNGSKRYADGHWEIRIKSISDLAGLTRSFPIEKHGSSDSAKQAAIAALEDIKNNPAKYRKKARSERQSIIRYVTYSASAHNWNVVLTQGKDKKRVQKSFNDKLQNAQLEAERYALDNGLRPAIRGPQEFAPGLTGVPPISWSGDQEAFLVSHNGETWAYSLANFSNDLLAARTAAETHATNIAESLE